jgi:hypothetical protein
MSSLLDQTNMLSYKFIVQAHRINNIQVDFSIYTDKDRAELLLLFLGCLQISIL